MMWWYFLFKKKRLCTIIENQLSGTISNNLTGEYDHDSINNAFSLLFFSVNSVVNEP